MNSLSLITLFALFLAGAAGKGASASEDHVALVREFESWNAPHAGFRLAGNIYYVGPKSISSFLITSAEGHILIDSGFSNSVPIIRSNIVALGFKPEDIRYLLCSHAHIDHVGGHAAFKRLTGAKVAASEKDAVLLASGGKTDFLFGSHPLMQFEAVQADVAVREGTEIRVGGTVLKAHLTPGHTSGATTWTMTVQENGRTQKVVFFSSTSINPGTKLVGNTAYPRIVEDIEATYRTLKAMPCDIFLAPHPSFFGMTEKLARGSESAPNPFIDPTEMGRFLDTAEKKFRTELAAQRAASNGPR